MQALENLSEPQVITFVVYKIPGRTGLLLPVSFLENKVLSFFLTNKYQN